MPSKTKKNARRLRHPEFSKLIILMETAIVAYTTYRVLDIVWLAVTGFYTGSLPYLTTLISAVWAAYGTSVSFYYNKAKAENKLKLSGVTGQNATGQAAPGI